jgi:hypothetical protein
MNRGLANLHRNGLFAWDGLYKSNNTNVEAVSISAVVQFALQGAAA